MPGYHGHWGQSSGEGKRRITESTDVAYLTRCATGNTKWMRQAAAASPHLPTDVLHTLARHEDGYTRSVVAKNPATTEATLRLLVADPDKWVRRAVTAHPNTPADLLDTLARDTSEVVRKTLANRTGCPARVLRLLATDQDENVRKAVAYREDLHPDLIRLLAGDSSQWVRKAIGNRGASLDTDTTGRLIAAADHDVMFLTRNADLPMDEPTMLRVARDSNKWARCNVADRPDCLPSVLALLATDTDVDVRRRVAQNPNTNDEILTGLALGRATSVLLDIRNRPGGDQWLVEHPDPKVRANAPKVISSTGPLYEVLLRDPDAAVRLTAVRLAGSHPAVADLATDPDRAVRVAVAELTTETQVLVLLAGDDAWQVRRAVANHRLTDAHVLGQLAHDPEARVRAVVAERVLAAMSRAL